MITAEEARNLMPISANDEIEKVNKVIEEAAKAGSRKVKYDGDLAINDSVERVKFENSFKDRGFKIEYFEQEIYFSIRDMFYEISW